MSGLFRGSNATSPRTVLPLRTLGDSATSPSDQQGGVIGTYGGALWKLVTGSQGGYYTSIYYPNGTKPAELPPCGLPGCLFNLTADPTEHDDLSNSSRPEAQRILILLQSELDAAGRSYFQ